MKSSYMLSRSDKHYIQRYKEKMFAKVSVA